MLKTNIKQILLTLTTAIVFLGGVPLTKNNTNLSAQTTEEQIANRVCTNATKSVVTVKNGRGHGSGFIINKEGVIVTNAHVVDGNSQSVVTVVFSDGRQASADVIGFAKNGVDLAVLQVYNQPNLQPLPLAPRGSEKVGHRVFAIGSPLDPKYNNICTSGNITKVDNKAGEIIHQATINGGNSGGPLVNTQGQVIGVNTWGELIPVYGPSGRQIGLAKGGSEINRSQPVKFVHELLAAKQRNDLAPQSTLARNSGRNIINLTLNGQNINGTFEEDSYENLYKFEGKKGQPVSVEMKSQQINSLLKLYRVVVIPTPQGLKQDAVLLARNDDQGPGNFDAKISTILPDDGIYLVVAGSSGKIETGNYSLKAVSSY